MPVSKDVVFEELRNMRLALAQEEMVPAFCIFHDRTLLEIAERMPQNIEELLQIRGIGPSKLEKYGEAVLEVTTKYDRTSEWDNQHEADDFDAQDDYPCDSIELIEVDPVLLTKMLQAVAIGVNPDTGEIIDTDSIINNSDFKAAIKTINKKYNQARGSSKKTKYQEWEEMFPDSVVIRKEGFFYTARNDSALRLHEAVGYRLNKDISGSYITGGPQIDKITEALKSMNLSYVVVEGDAVTEEFIAERTADSYKDEQSIEAVDTNETDEPASTNETAYPHEDKPKLEVKKAVEPEFVKMCDNCKLYRIGDCGGIGGPCEFYQYAPTTSEEELKSWPTDMGPYVTGYGNKYRR